MCHIWQRSGLCTTGQVYVPHSDRGQVYVPHCDKSQVYVPHCDKGSFICLIVTEVRFMCLIVTEVKFMCNILTGQVFVPHCDKLFVFVPCCDRLLEICHIVTDLLLCTDVTKFVPYFKQISVVLIKPQMSQFVSLVTFALFHMCENKGRQLRFPRVQLQTSLHIQQLINLYYCIMARLYIIGEDVMDSDLEADDIEDAEEQIIASDDENEGEDMIH